MRKVYLFVMALFAQLLTFNAFAQTDAEYEAALAAIQDGGVYYISTEVEGEKFYLTGDGNLQGVGEDGDLSGCQLFTLEKNSAGGFKQYGFKVHGSTYFSNPNSSSNIDDTSLHTNGDGRDTWEVQVFFLGENGKYAVRSTNATSTTDTSGWNWCGSAFWAVKAGDNGPYVGYSFDVTYVWELEVPAGKDMISLALNAAFDAYQDYYWEDFDDRTGDLMNMGEEPGQRTDWDSYNQFLDLLGQVNNWLELFSDPEWVYDPEDPEIITLEEAEALKAQLDSLYQTVLDSEVPYSLPNGDGYYRIIAHNLYKSTFDESGFVNKAIAASFEEAHEGKAVWGTLRRDRANFLWKLTQHGDSILIQNAGLGTYVSFSSPGEGRVIMTEDETDASHVVFDYAGWDYTELDGQGDDREIFCIRLASEPRKGNYFHQNGHSSTADDNSPWGNYGTDSGADQEISFWMRTWDYDPPRTTDLNTSEWFLEYVPDDEAQQVIADFDVIFNHDKLVAKNQALRDSVNNTLTLAKDVLRDKLITSASQMSSPFSCDNFGYTDGGKLSESVLIDGDKSTYWHTDYKGNIDSGNHYIQLTDMEDMVGDCEFYICDRATSSGNWPSELTLLGTDNLKNEDEDWEVIHVFKSPELNCGDGLESTIPFHVDEAYPYVRIVASAQSFWHAAEIQIYTVKENPNSQFVLMGGIAQDLQDAYDTNCAIADEDLTLADYEALKEAYDAFMEYGLVDPAELRAALATYKKATDCVTEGAGPGYWADMTVVNDYTALYNEIDAYNKAGRYKADEIHKYAVMLKIMQKSVMESANGVETDKWYRIMFPTEEMYDAYGFSKDGGDKCGDLAPEEQQTMWGTFVSAAKLKSEKETTTNDDGEEVTVTNNWLEDIAAEDLREGDRLFFMNDDAIEDKATSMFRFVELESDGADYTPVFSDVKENILMALDMSATYKQGNPLITKASQFSSNASYPGNDGQKLETGCLIDNNFSTYWHSDYSKKFCVVPYLQVALNEPVSGLIQVYVGRRNTSNGHVTRMYVQGSNDAEAWTNVGYIELPYTNASTPATSQPLDLGGTFSHLRFTMTNRAGSDGGSNVEFDPFAENLTADDYNTKFTYFHASEFQIYPVTPTKQLTSSVQALQDAYTTANKVVLKDATAEDLAAVAQAYQTFREGFNAAQGKNVLPKGLDKAPATYALQNKATGLYVMVSGTGNQNNIYLKAVPTLVSYKAMGYQRSLLIAKNTDGVSCNNLHAGETNRRFCTWGSTEPTSNSGLVIAEADAAFEVPAEYTFTKDIKPGRIYGLCNSVTLTPVGAPDEAVAYTPLGRYQNEDGDFLALKEIENIPAGQPVIYICGDTTSYDADDDYVEPVKFKFSTDEKLVLKGDTINGFIGSLVNHSLKAHEIYFSGNHAQCIGETGYYISGPCVVLDMPACPNVDPEGDYDFSICLNEEGDTADGVKDISGVLKNISKPGNVYSMDGKLLMTGATLNSLKTLGKGMYILNGVKVLVK